MEAKVKETGLYPKPFLNKHLNDAAIAVGEYCAMEDTPVVQTGFDVTCVIGRVELSRTGNLKPYQAAMSLIASHEASGVYTFPDMRNDGHICRVTVDFSIEFPEAK